MNLFSHTKKEYVCGENSPFASCHASSVAVMPDGSVFAAWFAGSREGADDVRIWGARRTVEGWTAPHVIAQQGNLPHWNPVLFVRPDGTVVLFYKIGREIPFWRTRVMLSDDSGKTWRDAGELVPGDQGGRGPVRNKVILLSSGRWLAPASQESGEWRSFADRSDDGGVTWRKSNEIFADLSGGAQRSPDFRDIPVSDQSFGGRGVIQPTLWESTPGRVHMLMRSSEGRIFRSDSEDSGETWCPGYATGLPNNNSGIDLARALDGRLFLVYNSVGINWGPRTPLRLACSGDNGESWNDVFVFEDTEGEYSYPAIIFHDGGLLVTYTYNRHNIAFWKLDLSEETRA